MIKKSYVHYKISPKKSYYLIYRRLRFSPTLNFNILLWIISEIYYNSLYNSFYL